MHQIPIWTLGWPDARWFKPWPPSAADVAALKGHASNGRIVAYGYVLPWRSKVDAYCIPGAVVSAEFLALDPTIYCGGSILAKCGVELGDFVVADLLYPSMQIHFETMGRSRAGLSREIGASKNSFDFYTDRADYDAMATAIMRAHGKCDCDGFACTVSTHPLPAATRHGQCTASLTGAEPPVLLHDHDDTTGADNYRVLCAPCAQIREKFVLHG